MDSLYAVLGAGGFVGSHVTSELKARRRDVLEVRRGDPLSDLRSCKYVIHCANSPSRYKAKKDPTKDYKESVLRTEEFLASIDISKTKFVLISSMSARTEPETVYGEHRLACERLVLNYGGKIIRLGYMYSVDRIYGALRDIINESEVFLSADSRYSYSDVRWNAKKIVDICEDSSVAPCTELGSSGSISLSQIAKILDSKSIFDRQKQDVQIAVDAFDDQPDISSFISYLNGLRSTENESSSTGK